MAEPGGGLGVLELSDVSKTFAGQVALRNASLRLRPGAVHALLGQNGSGKSTLIKILAGFHVPDPGAVATIAGEPFPFGSGPGSYRAGLRFVHQELDLIGDLSIVDNLALTHGYGGGWGWVSLGRERRHARTMLEALDLDLDPETKVRDLRPVMQTLVAIARAIGSEESVRVLVLDEPTASLPPPEVAMLFDAVAKARSRGIAVLYVSHNLSEITQIADEVTILRDGVVVAHVSSHLTHDRLVQLILGRELEAWTHQAQSAPQLADRPVVLEARKLSGTVIRDLDLEAHRGEILGIAGLLGSGRDELPYLLTGALTPTGGTISTGGHTYRRLTPRTAMRAGVVLVPADRKRYSAIPLMTARENVTLPRIPHSRLSYGIGLRRERSEAQSWLERLNVAPPLPERLFRDFSGGNQQKAVIARAARSNPNVLVIDQPVQGVDVANKAAIFDLLLREAATGTAIIIASSDPEDLVAVCDRVLFVASGRLVGEVGGKAITVEEISRRTLTNQRIRPPGPEATQVSVQ